MIDSGLIACRKVRERSEWPPFTRPFTSLTSQANGGEEKSRAICKNLEVNLLACWALDHCEEQAAEHRK